MPLRVAERVRDAAAPKNLRQGTSVSGPAGRGRVARNDAKDAVSSLELTRSLYDQPTLWDLVDRLNPKTDGRPRKLPEVIYLAGICLQHVYGSFRNIEAELSETVIWRAHLDIVAEMQREYRPNWPPLDVEKLARVRPLTAQNIHDARRTWAKPAFADLQEIFETSAARIARELGYGDPNGRGSINAFVRERMAATDGKVTRPIGSPYRTLTADEVDPARRISTASHVYSLRDKEIIKASALPEQGVHLYMTGAGPAVGHKTISTSLRNDLTNSTVVTTLRMQTTHGEADEAVTALIAVHRRLNNGLLGAVMDKAGAGSHIRRMASEAGLILVTPIKAKSTAGGTRVEKSMKVCDLTHEVDGVNCAHEYYAHGGGLAELVRNDGGEGVLHRLPSPKIARRENKDGTFRVYVTWKPTCRVGLHDDEPSLELDTLPWTITEEPGQDRLNVAENLRPVSPGSDRYEATYGWRQDQEARNNTRDERMRNRMARSRSGRRGWENEVGTAIVRNGLARRLHAKRNGLLAA